MASPAAPISLAYHYCGVDSFQKIVESGQFHLGNVSFMNDYMEVEWFKSISLAVLEQERARITSHEHAAYRAHALQSGQHAELSSPYISSNHSYFYQELAAWLLRPEFDHVYCACFSKKADHLSQWRGYADDARGVCLGFDLAAVDAETPMSRISEVIYDEGKQREAAKGTILYWLERIDGSVIDAMTKGASAVSSMRHHASEFKNPAFTDENEIRLIANVTMHGNGIDWTVNSGNLPHGLPSEFNFKYMGGRLVPYVQIPFPRDAIREVWLGPRFGNEIDEGAVRLFLSKHGAPAANNIRRSRASYRGNGNPA